jgi:hypothetical protein
LPLGAAGVKPKTTNKIAQHFKNQTKSPGIAPERIASPFASVPLPCPLARAV